jgi:hypothetical protein
MHYFIKSILEWKPTCFGQFLCTSSGVFHSTHGNSLCHTGLLTACRMELQFHPAIVYVIQVCWQLAGWNCSSILILLASCQQTCMMYTIAVCKVKNSWWCTEELSETCRISFQNRFEKLVHLVGFILRKFNNLVTQMTDKLYWTVLLHSRGELHQSRNFTPRSEYINTFWISSEMEPATEG